MALKRSDKVALMIIGIIIVIIVSLYFTFYYAYTCKDMACYESHQEKCSKTVFVNDAEDTVWKYFIQGKTDGKCEVEVTALVIKEGDISQKKLEGKSMTCLLPDKSTALPESDIARCSGELKEELQNLIIQKLHTYILENLGTISQELQQAI
jgi:hypothetical protein